MSNLTKTQKKKIADALERGVKDAVIADALKIELESVAAYREILGLSRSEITTRRYEYWKKMLNSGSTLVEIRPMANGSPRPEAERFSKGRPR